MNEVLKLLRIAHGYKVSELANMLDITQPYLSQIETGCRKPSDDLLEKYSKVFKVRLSTIMFFDKEKNSKNLKYQELLLLILQKICNNRNSNDA